MKIAARLRALATKLRPVARMKDWRQLLKERDEVREKLVRICTEVVANPPPPPTDEDRARWAREDEELHQRDPAQWRRRQEIREKLEAMARGNPTSLLGRAVKACGGGDA